MRIGTCDYFTTSIDELTVNIFFSSTENNKNNILKSILLELKSGTCYVTGQTR